MNKVKILFFATLRDRIGVRSIEIDIPEDATVQTLKASILAEYPSLRDLMEMSLASVNQEFASGETTLPANAEVALFPPVSGG